MKSANSSAAFGCGAWRATPMPCGRAITGSIAAQSTGAPRFLADSALA